MDYRKQLEFKNTKVRNNLIRLGSEEELLDQIMEPIAGMEEPFRYRNKAQFPIGVDKEGNLIAGFYAGRTHQIIPVPEQGTAYWSTGEQSDPGSDSGLHARRRFLHMMRNGTKGWCAMSWSVWIYNKRDHGLSDH